MWPYKCMAVTVTFIDSNKPANSSGALHTVQIAGVHVARARASTHTHTHTLADSYHVLLSTPHQVDKCQQL